MNLTSLLPWYVRWIAVALILAAAAGFGAVKMHEHDQVSYEALVAEYSDFKARVAAEGVAAQKQAAITAAANQKRKDDADAKVVASHAANDTAVRGMRSDTDSALGRLVPATPTGSDKPDTTCFDSSAYGSATRDLVEGLRGLAHEGAGYQIDLDADKSWAQGANDAR